MHHRAVLFIIFSFGCFCPGLSTRDHCPEVKPLSNFNIFAVLGPWYVMQYYSSSEESLTYRCMRMEFGLSNGNMDMKMRFIYKYADDPTQEVQTGNITWQIPNPMRPEHWRHTEDHYKGVYNTDVVDTDHTSWLILLHCSDPEKFLSTFVLSRTPYMDKATMNYLGEKVGSYDGVDLDYLFPVNQSSCIEGYPEPSAPEPRPQPITSTVLPIYETVEDQDLYFVEDTSSNKNEDLDSYAEGVFLNDIDEETPSIISD